MLYYYLTMITRENNNQPDCQSNGLHGVCRVDHQRNFPLCRVLCQLISVHDGILFCVNRRRVVYCQTQVALEF